jgi:integrase
MKSGMVEQRHGRACPGTERCGCSWSYRVDTPDAIDGKRRQLRKGGYPNKTTAKEALADVQRRMANGEQVGGSITVSEYLKDWFRAKEAAGRKPSTLAQYQDLMLRFLEPQLGKVKLADLRAVHVEAMLASMEAEGRGIVTRRRTVAVLSSALGSAVKRRLVPWNVCQQLELPPERTERRPVWDAGQAQKFLAHVGKDRLAVLWRLYCLRGLRRGEALALAWEDVDLETGTLWIHRNLGEVDGKLTWGTPKTVNGTRSVAVDPLTVTELRSHRRRQATEKLALGAAYDDQNLVFAAENGRPIWPGSVSARFHVLSDAAGLPRIRLHDLRHSAASLALAAGVDLKTVSSNLGHSGISITANLYAHVLPSTARAAADSVAAMVDENTV